VAYSFLVETCDSERLKTLNVWSMFADADLDLRPHPNLARDRTPREHMVHQCMSEAKWFASMFGIDVGPALPANETRLAFIRHYADDSGKRLAALETKDAACWAARCTAIEGESRGGAKTPLPGPGPHPSTERT